MSIFNKLFLTNSPFLDKNGEFSTSSQAFEIKFHSIIRMKTICFNYLLKLQSFPITTGFLLLILPFV